MSVSPASSLFLLSSPALMFVAFVFSSGFCSLLLLVRRLTRSLLFVVVVLAARLDLRWGVS